tara:strand:- start:108 stop:746 length:639 start_codon:yes stop_codon:yes gene_type:complete
MKNTKNIIIFANGELPTSKKAYKELLSNKFILCCDGAVLKAESLEHEPDLIIGDLDSINNQIKKKYKNKIIKIKNQDSNDLFKALHWAEENNVESATIIGADGGSDDHYLGNLFIILENDFSFKIKLITNNGQFDLTNGEEFSSIRNQRVSLFCLDKEAKITSYGLKYKLKNYQFNNLYGATLNIAKTKKFKIECDSPKAKILVFRSDDKTR